MSQFKYPISIHLHLSSLLSKISKDVINAVAKDHTGIIRDASVPARILGTALLTMVRWCGPAILLALASAKMYLLVLITNGSIQATACASVRKYTVMKATFKTNTLVNV